MQRLYSATPINPLQALEYKIICFVISQLFTDLHGLKFLQYLYIVHFSHEIGAPTVSGSERAQKRSMWSQLHFSFSILHFPSMTPKIMQKLAFVNRGISAESNLV